MWLLSVSEPVASGVLFCIWCHCQLRLQANSQSQSSLLLYFGLLRIKLMDTGQICSIYSQNRLNENWRKKVYLFFVLVPMWRCYCATNLKKDKLISNDPVFQLSRSKINVLFLPTNQLSPMGSGLYGPTLRIDERCCLFSNANRLAIDAVLYKGYDFFQIMSP